ncbi:hypothetical protein RZS08_29110, partial [Arthrospira platensis SPKY1]|nr:hypothetical protein [Arthrospira platensis SPKY1]
MRTELRESDFHDAEVKIETHRGFVNTSRVPFSYSLTEQPLASFISAYLEPNHNHLFVFSARPSSLLKKWMVGSFAIDLIQAYKLPCFLLPETTERCT